jgi:outer membrane protein OmpA-like peptidoglycan-associated protein
MASRATIARSRPARKRPARNRRRRSASPGVKRRRRKIIIGAGIAVAVIAAGVLYFLFFTHSNTTFNEIVIQPRPDSPATVSADVNAELSQTVANGGQLLITEVAGSTVAPAFYGGLTCSPGTNKLICEQSTSGTISKAQHIADGLVTGQDPGNPDLYAVFTQTAGYISEHPGHYQAINLWINTTGEQLAPVNLSELTASSNIHALAHQAVTSGAFPGPQGCHGYQVHMVVPPSGSAAQQQALRQLFSTLVNQCGGTLATWTSRWIAPSGPIPLPGIQGAEPISHGFVLSDRLKDFAVGSAALTPIAKRALSQIAVVIEARSPGQSITCTGSTDGTGSAAFDDVLSRQRAVAVCDYLASQGINSQLLHCRGTGKATPVAADPSLRRVVITVGVKQ